LRIPAKKKSSVTEQRLQTKGGGTGNSARAHLQLKGTEKAGIGTIGKVRDGIERLIKKWGENKGGGKGKRGGDAGRMA